MSGFASPQAAMQRIPPKAIPASVDFIRPLAQYIAGHYQVPWHDFEDKLNALQNLRTQAAGAGVDEDGLRILQRYFGQLEYVLIKFPLAPGRVVIPFKWQDAFGEDTETIALGAYERAAVLFNLGALQATLAAQCPRSDVHSTKAVCAYFQAAAGCFHEIRTAYSATEHCASTYDLRKDTLAWLELLMLAQAQECMIERSIADQGKPSVLSKLAVQCSLWYQEVHDAVLPDRKVLDKYDSYAASSEVKSVYFIAMAYYYRGLAAQTQNEHGECVAYLQEAVNQARKAVKLISKAIPPETQEAANALEAQAEASFSSAVRDNLEIYHELVPETLPELLAAALAKPTPLPTGEAAINLAGPDLFAALISNAVLEAVSVYSEEKAQILRAVLAEFQQKDGELRQLLDSMGLTSGLGDDVGVELPLEVRRARAALHEIGGSEGLLTPLTALSRVADTLQPALARVQSMQQVEQERNVALRAADSRYGGDGSVPRLTSETDACAAAYDLALSALEKLRRQVERNEQAFSALKSADWEQRIENATDKDKIERSRGRLKEHLANVAELKDERERIERDLRDKMNRDDITDLLVRATADSTAADPNALMADQLKKYDELIAEVRANVNGQDSVMNSVTEAYTEYDLAVNGGARGEVLREVTEVAKAFTLCHAKIREAEAFWVNFEDMVTRLARGWGDAASERECEEERLKFILPRREAPPPPPRASKPSLDSIPTSNLPANDMAVRGYNPYASSEASAPGPATAVEGQLTPWLSLSGENLTVATHAQECHPSGDMAIHKAEAVQPASSEPAADLPAGQEHSPAHVDGVSGEASAVSHPAPAGHEQASTEHRANPPPSQCKGSSLTAEELDAVFGAAFKPPAPPTTITPPTAHTVPEAQLPPATELYTHTYAQLNGAYIDHTAMARMSLSVAAPAPYTQYIQGSVTRVPPVPLAPPAAPAIPAANAPPLPESDAAFLTTYGKLARSVPPPPPLHPAAPAAPQQEPPTQPAALQPVPQVSPANMQAVDSMQQHAYHTYLPPTPQQGYTQPQLQPPNMAPYMSTPLPAGVAQPIAPIPDMSFTPSGGQQPASFPTATTSAQPHFVPVIPSHDPAQLYAAGQHQQTTHVPSQTAPMPSSVPNTPAQAAPSYSQSDGAIAKPQASHPPAPMQPVANRTSSQQYGPSPYSYAAQQYSTSPAHYGAHAAAHPSVQPPQPLPNTYQPYQPAYGSQQTTYVHPPQARDATPPSLPPPMRPSSSTKPGPKPPPKPPSMQQNAGSAQHPPAQQERARNTTMPAMAAPAPIVYDQSIFAIAEQTGLALAAQQRMLQMRQYQEVAQQYQPPPVPLAPYGQQQYIPNPPAQAQYSQGPQLSNQGVYQQPHHQ